MITHKKPVRLYYLYYASIGSSVLEYAAAIYFMMSLAQTFVTSLICLLIAFVVSTYTLVMWDTVSTYWHKNAVISLIVVFVLNIPAFIYDVHGFLGVTSELNAEFESHTDVAKQESRYIDSQLANGSAKFELNPQEVLKEISGLTAKNNRLAGENKSFIADKKHCKLSYGTCVAALDEKISANNELIRSNKETMSYLNNSLSQLGIVVNANLQTKRDIQSLLSGANENRKAHEVFKNLSYWIYGNINQAKYLQSNILAFSSIFLATLVMLLSFLATQLCFDDSDSKTALEENPDNFGIIERLNGLRMPSPTPAQTTAFLNTQQAEPENLESVFQRGHTQKLSDDPSTEKNNPIGFMNWEKPVAIDKPFKKVVDKAVNRIDDAASVIANAVNQQRNAVEKSVQIDAPVASIQTQTNADAINNCSNATGRNATSLKGLDELIDCVMSTDTLFKLGGIISQNKVEEFMNVGRPRAKKFIDALKAKNILDADGRKQKNVIQ